MGSETHTSPVEFGTGSGNGAAAAEVETEKSRRALLKGLGVAAAGAVVGSVLSPEEAQAHGTFHADSNTLDPAIHGNNTDGGAGVVGSSSTGNGVRALSGSGTGMLGDSTSGTGVIGASTSGTGVFGTGGSFGMEGFSSSGTGVLADSINGTGVRATSNSGPGVSATSINGPGVSATSNSGHGVAGSSVHGHGVEGSSDNGTGVDGNGGNIGVSGNGGNIGVLADSGTGGTAVLARNVDDGGLALNVVGPAKFSTAGVGTIPANQNSVVVSDPAVTANSHITMTYTGNPGLTGSGTFAAVVWVERQPGTGFTARLSRRVTNATPFTYLIVEPG